MPVVGRPEPGRPWVARAALVVCLAIFVASAFRSLVRESATWDETHYFGLGKHLLETGRWDVPGSILHPPLSFYLSSLPLLSVELEPALFVSDPRRANDLRYLGAADYERGQALLSSDANEDDRLLTRSRLVNVALAALLGAFVFAWSHALHGPRAAALASILYFFCPNVLAHARLITPDLPLTAFSFLSIHFLWRGLREERLGLSIVGGIALGLALLSKFTALLLLPVSGILLALWWSSRGRSPLRAGLVFGTTGLAVLCVGYGMHLGPYVDGLRYQWAHVGQGHAGFLLGAYSDRGWWYYFLVSFVLKTPLAALVLLGIAAVGWIRSTEGHTWLDNAFLLVPAVTIFAFFSASPQAIGLRYVLPVYPFLFVFVSSAARAFTSRPRALGAAALVAWYVGASWWIHPHYLAYFNELIGGPRHGYEALVDSNLDWGQDLKGLKQWMDERGVSRVQLSYFGSDSPDRYGIAHDWLPSVPPRPLTRDVGPALHGWVAISATNLQGVYLADRDLFSFFRTREPDAVIGYSIFLYDLGEGR